PVRAAGKVGHVRTSVRLGERVCAEVLAARHLREQPPPLFFGEPSPHAVAPGQQAGHAQPRPGELFRHQAVLEHPETETPQFLGDEDAEEAHVSHLLPQAVRDHALLRVELVGQREHLVHGEFPGELLDPQSLLGQVAGHRSTRPLWSVSHRFSQVTSARGERTFLRQLGNHPFHAQSRACSLHGMNGRSPVAALISDSSRGNKAAILNAALAAFGEKGFNGASMRDIARGAGTSLSNLYNYFPSKSHLLAELLQRANDELLNRTSTAVRNAGSSPTERMREAVKAYVGFVVDHQTAALVAISEIRYLHGEHREQVVRARDST